MVDHVTKSRVRRRQFDVMYYSRFTHRGNIVGTFEIYVKVAFAGF